ncbi:MAG: (d)CMP kinase [Nitrospirota bacterium]
MADGMGRVIAIDGPSGSGKTTVARLVAKDLGLGYLDTGSLYRAIALALRENQIVPEDNDDKISQVLKRTHIGFHQGKVLLNERDVSEEIRNAEIDHYSSVFSARKIIRDFLLDLQRNAGATNDLVVEGRDTTTVVFPDAEKKIFLSASTEERARRRYIQFKERGIEISMDQARRGIMERDERDTNRDIAPLKIAPDALIIDSSNLSVEQVRGKILEFIRSDP